MTTPQNLDASTTGLEVASLFPASIRNKTILITGVSRSGIGGTTAHAFASQLPKLLILSGRNVGKIQEVADDITQKYDGKVPTRVLQMDLSSQKSVRKAAAELMGWEDLEGLDLLVNNAGVMAIPEKALSEEGVEMQFATNHVGHFLFTNLVRGKLIASAEKQRGDKGAVKVINVTSTGHMFSPVRFSDINFDKSKKEISDEESPDYTLLGKFGITWDDEKQTYNSVVAYAQSKTANILFSLQLQKIATAKYGIASFAPHPGSIPTELQRHADEGMLKRAREKAVETGLLPPKRKTLEEGCATTVLAATDPELVNRDGTLYLEDCQAVEVKQASAADQQAAKRLWEISERLVGEKFEW